MRDDIFAKYAAWFEAISGLLGTWWIGAIVAITLASPLLAFFKARSIKTALPIAVLGVATSLIIFGCYILERGSALAVTSVFLGGLLLFVYACVFGLHKPPPSPSRFRADVVAGCLIVLVTIVKCTQLEEWPPLLTDYAAMTGVSAVLQYLPDSEVRMDPSLRGYLDRGGASPLHAPLLHGLFQVFGYSSFAVRSAEVIGSTATLIFLWMWLRLFVSARWGLVALGLFSLSSEHLSQSRMGTIFSISQALTVCTLWMWTVLRQGAALKAPYAVGLAVSCIAINYCYLPAKAAWGFSIGMLLLSVGDRYLSRKKMALAAFLAVLVGISVYSALYVWGPFLSFVFIPPQLATDTPVWLKTADGALSRLVQSPWTVLVNIVQNMYLILAEAASFSRVVEPIYVFFGSLLLPLCIIGLWSPRWRFISSFVLCGVLPSLLAFPINRRSLMARPFVSILLALFAFEYITALRATMSPRLRGAATAILLSLLAALPLHGLYLFARYNGPIGVGPSFGPEYAYDMIKHLKILSKDHSIVLMNPDRGLIKYEMAFARELYIEKPRLYNLTACSVVPTDTQDALPKTTPPTVYAVLNEDSRTWIVPWLQSKVAGVNIRSYERDGRTLYWLGTVNESQR